MNSLHTGLARTVNSVALAVSLVLVHAAMANAESPATSPLAATATESNSLNLDEVVVTASATATTKMKSSSSVSTLSPDEIALAAPISAADILRDIPGIHSEASAGEGNTNLTVRGIPISAGGTRYVGFQEDGLPVLLNGDYAFVTPDMFVKLDNSLERIEVVRGGSASVLATNSPGAIINFISKTGEEEGGSVAVSKGLDFDETRLDAGYGQHISDTTRFYVGGFYRTGDGPRNGGVPIERGGQIKFNLTHDLDQNGSYVRVSFKHLDDQTPLNMPVAFSLSNSSPTKANPATIDSYPGIDPRKASYYSPYWPGITQRNADNGLTVSNLNDGLQVKEDALGLRGHFELGSGWKLDESFKDSRKSGKFLVAYPTGAPFTPNAPVTYAAGPSQGQAYNGQVIELSAFDASLDNLNSIANVLRLTNRFDFSNGASITPVLGWDINNQTIHVNQNLPHYLFTASGDKPVPVAGNNANGVATDASGLLPDSKNWSEQNRELQYDMNSVYLNVGAEIAGFDLDGGVRNDKETVTGFQSNTQAASAATPYLPGTFPSVPTTAVDYKVSHTSWSIGANYRFTDNLAVFARESEGVAFNVVERMGGPFIGGAPIPVNTVEQTEVGLKFRSSGFESFVTFFSARTAEGNYDVTTRVLSANHYSAQGVELEGGYHVGGFQIRGGFTYTDAKIIGSNDPTVIDNQPHRLAKYIYQLSPSYSWNALTIGGSIIGTDKSFGDDQNTIIQPSFATVNAFARYEIGSHAFASLSANNLFNTIGWTEYDNGQGARSINGRTVRATVGYKF